MQCSAVQCSAGRGSAVEFLAVVNLWSQPPLEVCSAEPNCVPVQFNHQTSSLERERGCFYHRRPNWAEDSTILVVLLAWTFIGQPWSHVNYAQKVRELCVRKTIFAIDKGSFNKSKFLFFLSFFFEKIVFRYCLGATFIFLVKTTTNRHKCGWLLSKYNYAYMSMIFGYKVYPHKMVKFYQNLLVKI